MEGRKRHINRANKKETRKKINKKRKKNYDKKK
jgi:hypothetical protein